MQTRALNYEGGKRQDCIPKKSLVTLTSLWMVSGRLDGWRSSGKFRGLKLQNRFVVPPVASECSGNFSLNYQNFSRGDLFCLMKIMRREKCFKCSRAFSKLNPPDVKLRRQIKISWLIIDASKADETVKSVHKNLHNRQYFILNHKKGR